MKTKQNFLSGFENEVFISKTLQPEPKGGYANMNKVMRIIKEKNLQIVSQKMEMDCEIEVKTRKKNAEMVFDIFDSMFEIQIEKKGQNSVFRR